MRKQVFQLLNDIEASYLLLEKENDFNDMTEFQIVKELTELIEWNAQKEFLNKPPSKLRLVE